ncbi:MAG: hypothetical protein ACYCOX_07870 [Acidobacteriaceae bacterium]
MELLLNLVWLLLSLALLAGAWSSWCCVQGPPGRTERRRRYLTVFVLSFLLLPVISMTDDLHAMTTMAESERTDLKVAAVQSQHLQDRTQIHPAFSAGPDYLEVRCICIGLIGPFRLLPDVAAPPIALQSDRAPPEK